MLTLIISGIDVTEYVTDYDVSRSASSNSANGFPNWDGTIIDEKGNVIPASKITTSISAALKKVPRSVADEIAQAVEATSFDVTYASPSEASGTFMLSSYRATSRRFGDEWDIDIACDSDNSSEVSGGSL